MPLTDHARQQARETWNQWLAEGAVCAVQAKDPLMRKYAEQRVTSTRAGDLGRFTQWEEVEKALYDGQLTWPRHTQSVAVAAFMAGYSRKTAGWPNATECEACTARVVTEIDGEPFEGVFCEYRTLWYCSRQCHSDACSAETCQLAFAGVL